MRHKFLGIGDPGYHPLRKLATVFSGLRYAVLYDWSVTYKLIASVVVLALFGVVRMAISGLTGLVIVYAILSWVQTQSMAADFLERLVLPVLIPIRRVVPLIGGIDLSPLVLLLILQVAGIVLGSVQAAVLFAI